MDTQFVPKEFTLTLGIHNGTITSRDTEQPKYFDTLEECKAEVTRAEMLYASMGYFIWFANATNKQGNSFKLHPGTFYKS